MSYFSCISTNQASLVFVSATTAHLKLVFPFVHVVSEHKLLVQRSEILIKHYPPLLFQQTFRCKVGRLIAAI